MFDKIEQFVRHPVAPRAIAVYVTRMIFECQNYRSYLKTLLLEKQKLNPSYSLRAMAKQLGFSSSQLSEAMSGKANFSTTSLRKIASKLQLSTDETEYLCLLGQLETQQAPELRESLLKSLQKLSPLQRPIDDLTVDYFKQISDWYHSAILELLYLRNFKFNSENISFRLGISKIEADLAIERLIRLELIEKNSKGGYTRLSPNLQVRSPEKNAAMRKFYRQMFEKASQSLDSQDPKERWSGYETLPVSIEAMPEIRKACDNFFEEIIQISRKYPNKKNVYHLFVHFFNLTPERKS